MSAGQDARFQDKQKKLMKEMKFPKELDLKVNLKKIDWTVMKEWIAKRVTELLNFEDEVVIGYIFEQLDPSKVSNGKEIHVNLVPFLEKNTSLFTKELWSMLHSANQTESGIPLPLLEAKHEELKKRKQQEEELQEQMRKRREESARLRALEEEQRREEREKERAVAREKDKEREREKPLENDRDDDMAERPVDRDRPPDRERPVDRRRERDRPTDKERDRDHGFDRERPREREFERDGARDRPREREFDRENDRARPRERDREFDRGSERDRPRERDRPFARDNDRDGTREREAPRERPPGRERDFDPDQDRDKSRGKDREFDRDRERDRERGGGVDRNRDRGRPRDFDRDREGDRPRGGFRERERPYERERFYERERDWPRLADRAPDRPREQEREPAEPVERSGNREGNSYRAPDDGYLETRGRRPESARPARDDMDYPRKTSPIPMDHIAASPMENDERMKRAVSEEPARNEFYVKTPSPGVLLLEANDDYETRAATPVLDAELADPDRAGTYEEPAAAAVVEDVDIDAGVKEKKKKHKKEKKKHKKEKKEKKAKKEKSRHEPVVGDEDMHDAPEGGMPGLDHNGAQGQDDEDDIEMLRQRALQAVAHSHRKRPHEGLG